MPDSETTDIPLTPPGPKKVLFETDTNSNYWTDFHEAYKVRPNGTHSGGTDAAGKVEDLLLR